MANPKVQALVRSLSVSALVAAGCSSEPRRPLTEADVRQAELQARMDEAEARGDQAEMRRIAEALRLLAEAAHQGMDRYEQKERIERSGSYQPRPAYESSRPSSSYDNGPAASCGGASASCGTTTPADR